MDNTKCTSKGSQGSDSAKMKAANASKELPRPRLVIQISILCLLTSCSLGYHFSSVNLPKEHLIRFINDSYTLHYGSGLPAIHLNSIYGTFCAILLGAMLPSTLIAHYFLNRLGRKPTITLVHGTSSILGNLAIILSLRLNSFELLVAGRAFIGISYGFLISSLTVYIAECSPHRFRGMLGSIQSITIGIGCIIGTVVNSESMLGTKELWPFGLALFPLVSSAILLTGSFALPESPKFVFQQGNINEALDILRFTQSEKDAEETTEEMQLEMKLTTKQDAGSLSNALKDKSVQAAIAVGFLLNTLVGTSGLVAVEAYSGLMLSTTAPSEERNLLGVAAGIMAVTPIASGVSSAIADKFPRRALLFGSCGVCGITLTLVSALEHIPPGPGWAVGTAALMVHAAAAQIGPSCIVLILPTEISITSQRALVCGVSVAGQNISGLLVLLLFPILHGVIGGYSLLCLFVGPMFLTCLLVYRLLPETKGITAREATWRLANQNQTNHTSTKYKAAAAQ